MFNMNSKDTKKVLEEENKQLKKLLPFIDFILEVDPQKYSKFHKMKNWITNEQLSSVNTISLTKKSILAQYRNYLCHKSLRKIPQYIQDLFKDMMKQEEIDLCSDDENPTDIDNLHGNQNSKIIANQSSKNYDSTSPIDFNTKENKNLVQFCNDEDILFSRPSDQNKIKSCGNYAIKNHEVKTIFELTQILGTNKNGTDLKICSSSTLKNCENSQASKELLATPSEQHPPQPVTNETTFQIKSQICSQQNIISTSSYNQINPDIKDPRVVKYVKLIQSSPQKSDVIRNTYSNLTSGITQGVSIESSTIFPTVQNNNNRCVLSNSTRRELNSNFNKKLTYGEYNQRQPSEKGASEKAVENQKYNTKRRAQYAVKKTIPSKKIRNLLEIKCRTEDYNVYTKNPLSLNKVQKICPAEEVPTSKKLSNCGITQSNIKRREKLKIKSCDRIANKIGRLREAEKNCDEGDRVVSTEEREKTNIELNYPMTNKDLKINASKKELKYKKHVGKCKEKQTMKPNTKKREKANIKKSTITDKISHTSGSQQKLTYSFQYVNLFSVAPSIDVESSIDKKEKTTTEESCTMTEKIPQINGSGKTLTHRELMDCEDQPSLKCNIEKNRVCKNYELISMKPTRVKTKTNNSKYSRKKKITVSRRREDYLLKNIDTNMTERNTNTCIFCKTTPTNLTDHYIRKHNKESYVSRLTSNELKDLRLNIPFVKIISNQNREQEIKYEIKCIFCGLILQETFNNLLYHFSIHTGEYTFGCCKCGLQKPYRANILSHITRRNGKCANAKIREIYQYPPHSMAIYLNYCSLCNFVQLNQPNIYKHLHDHHNERNDDPKKIGAVVIAAINDFPDGESIKITNEGNNNPETLLAKICENSTKLYEFRDINTDRAINVTSNAISEVQFSLNVSDSNLTNDLRKHINTDNNDPKVDEMNTPKRQSKKIGDYSICKLQNFGYRLKYTEFNIPNCCLYKCLGTDCFYSTDIKENLLRHLIDHNTNENPSEKFLECAYCVWHLHDNLSITPQLLVDHIEKCHQGSRFQCGICCYRSRTARNVCIHSKISHKVDDNKMHKIFECQKMMENVRKFKCKNCLDNFDDLNNLENHIRKCNDDPLGYQSCLTFNCIYCSCSFEAEERAEEHLALIHPIEIPVFCKRELQSIYENDTCDNLYLIDLTSLPLPLGTVICNICDVNENQEMKEFDIKPTENEMIETNKDILKALLLKLTKDTGILPDRLYQCPFPYCCGLFSIYKLWLKHVTHKHLCMIVSCPHCSENLDVSVSKSIISFEQHIISHKRKLYVCFYCGECAVDEQEIREHGTRKHGTNDNQSIRVIRIPFNLSCSYFIFVFNEGIKTELTFLITLQNTLRERIKSNENSEKLKSYQKWIVPGTAVWVEDFPTFKLDTNTNNRCMMCAYIFNDFEDLLRHLSESHTINSEAYCNICSFRKESCTWYDVVEHRRMHSTYLNICSTCLYFHFDYKELSTHIQKNHDSSDVIILKLERTNQKTYVSINFVFATSFRTFSTIKTCFFCKKQVANLAYHLKNIHKVFLNYFCQLCNVPLKNLGYSSEHFKTHHNGKLFKIFCTLETNAQICVIDIRPLELHIQDDDISRNFKNVNINGKNTKENGDDLEMFDDEDMITNKETNMIGNYKQNRVSEGAIKCINIKNLQTDNIGTSKSLSLQEDHQVPSITPEFISSDLIGDLNMVTFVGRTPNAILGQHINNLGSLHKTSQIFHYNNYDEAEHSTMNVSLPIKARPLPIVPQVTEIELQNVNATTNLSSRNFIISNSASSLITNSVIPQTLNRVPLTNIQIQEFSDINQIYNINN